MKKEAMHYKVLKDKIIQCQLCPRFCMINPGERGFCKVRENQDGKLIALVYGAPCSVAVDPIEKKPFFHFLPGTRAFSVGTTGCNLACKFCQNWTTSQVGPEKIPSFDLPPKELVERAIDSGAESIAYTYNEPSIFFEYVLDTAKLAKKKGMRNVTVTNGFVNKEPLRELYKYIDAANVDLKGFTEEYYKEVCNARLQPVLDTIKELKKMNVWLEITTLIVPTLNDDMKLLKKQCEWLKGNVGLETPLHFSRFFPCYNLETLQPTPIPTLQEAKKIAEKIGFSYVYLGNVMGENENTVCPNCDKTVLWRTSFFEVKRNDTVQGACKHCNHFINGVWK